MKGYSQSAVVRARSVLIEVAAGGGTITRQALARRLQLRYDFRSSNDRHMMVSLLGAVAELEYSYGRPFLSVVVAEGRREGDLFYWGLLGYAEALKFPDRSTVRKFVAAERKRAHEHWSGRVHYPDGVTTTPLDLRARPYAVSEVLSDDPDGFPATADPLFGSI